VVKKASKEPEQTIIPAGKTEGACIVEEQVGSRMKYRARLPTGTVVVSGPVRWQRTTAEQDLDKMEEALTSDGHRAVQRIQPDLFRIRDKRPP